MNRAPGARRPAEELAALVTAGRADLPLPGGGATWRRFEALAALARRDVVLGRLAEAHADALAILAELGAPPAGAPGAPSVPGAGGAGGADVWGVWAAEPPDPVLRAERTGHGWVLRGVKAWCSGASTCTRALVTARTGDDVRPLFAVDLTHPGVRAVPGTWPAVGMAASDSGEVAFDAVPATPVGGEDGYLTRSGFWHGAVGVAAAWWGGACGVADALADRGRAGRLDAHASAHLGRVAASLAGARWSLVGAAAEIDADPLDEAGGGVRRATAVRAVVEEAATTVVHEVGRALGAAPLCADAAHAARVADLTVYLRQSHAERDLVALAAEVVRAGGPDGAGAAGSADERAPW